MTGIVKLKRMCESDKEYRSEMPKPTPRRLKVSVPVKANVLTEEGLKEFDGRLEEIGEGNARICLDHPLAEGTELSVVVMFLDRRGREIRFRYEGKVASAVYDPWYEVAVDFEEGVAISGAQAREILAELFPEEG